MGEEDGEPLGEAVEVEVDDDTDGGRSGNEVSGKQGSTTTGRGGDVCGIALGESGEDAANPNEMPLWNPGAELGGDE